jgi:cell wall-associated NlpC family hydrolase/SH3-like domain-containing protein
MNFKKFILTAAISAAVFSLAALSASAQTGYVTADVLKVRATTGTYATVIDRVTNGTELELLAYDGSWYKVQLPNGTIGYVSADYVALTPTSSVTYGYVNATVLKIHSSTGVNSPVTGRILSGAKVELLAYDGSWYKIKTEDGTEGYVSAEYISLTSDTVAAPSVTYGYVTADILKVHTSTGISTPVICRISKDERVELLSYDGSWYKIKTSDNLEGYVSAQYISLTKGGEPTVSVGYIDATILNIRELPGTETTILTQLVMGTEVELLAYDGSWYKVRLSDGTEGYANADYISRTPIEKSTVTAAANGVIASQSVTPPSSSTLTLGESIIATAKNYIGTPYVYGASGPDSFDCSGFVMYVMNKNGIKLPHQSGMQYEMGFEVAMDELIAGDLVFFNSSSKSTVSHVGIYIGNGKFIHASSGSTHAVTISSLSEDYYSAHYLGARRVI